MLKAAFKNSYGTRAKPVPLLHIAKILWFNFAYEKWDEKSLPDLGEVMASQRFARIDSLIDQQNENISANVIGHSTCLIRIGGLTIVTDPVWSSVAGPFGLIGPKRRQPSSIAIESLPKIDIILLSHDHYDHLDKKALQFLKERDDPFLITGQNVLKHVRWSSDRSVELAWFDKVRLGGLEITFTPAQHFSGRGVWFNRSLWGGFVLKHDTGSIYYTGDTGYNEDMFHDIKQRCGDIDLGILPIGAYKPYHSLKSYHLDPQAAIAVHEMFRFKASIAVHFGTYQMSIESINTQVEDFMRIWSKSIHAKDFILPQFGQCYTIQLD